MYVCMYIIRESVITGHLKINEINNRYKMKLSHNKTVFNLKNDIKMRCKS